MTMTQPRAVPKMPARRKPQPSFRLSARGGAAAAIAMALLLGVVESTQQQRHEDALMTTTAQAIVRKAQAVDSRAQIVALRTYVRRHVTWHGAEYRRTRMLRATASRTLQSGRGYCGEDTRLFICLAHAVGIPAQRVNLYGRHPHVVAEVQLQPGNSLLVDCQNPPIFADLERLDDVMARHRYGYVDYSTIHLGRFHLLRLLRRVQLQLGVLGWWLESPHLVVAVLYGMALCLLLGTSGFTVAMGSIRRLDARSRGTNGAAAAHEAGDAAGRPTSSVHGLFEQLHCPQCQGRLSPGPRALASGTDGVLCCHHCEEKFPVQHGIPRMLLSPLRELLLGGQTGARSDVRAATAQSFGFEWRRFSEMRAEWERNFLEYMAPHGPEFFRGKRVLDAGCGSGRHAYYAAQYGAEVWALDLGPAVEVARRNTADCPAVHVIQGDLNQPPFDTESFDFIYSIGVLHHLSDPEGGFRNLLRFLKPAGQIQIYLYWAPEGQPMKQLLLALLTAARKVTTRLPYSVIHAISYPAAWAAFGLFVGPYRLLRSIPGCRWLAERIPMKQYAHYPFGVCVNDQFDRLSAPIENRYTKAEVEGWLRRAGLENVVVWGNCGWGGSGRKPLRNAGVSSSEQESGAQEVAA